MNNDTTFVDNVQFYLCNLFAHSLDMPADELDEDSAFFALGVTSLISTEIVAALGEFYDDLSATLLFEYPNIASLTNFLAHCSLRPGQKEAFGQTIAALTDGPSGGGGLPSEDELAAEDQDSEEPHLQGAIAVIGIGGRFPEADNPLELFDNLLAHRDSVGEIPAGRWSHAELYSPAGEKKDAISGKWGGFINDLEKFDAKFFKILPAEAEVMDPQQKLFLECSWAAMEDGGYGKISQLPTTNIGVYAGVTWNEFSNYANEFGHLQGDHRGAGSLYWGIPNRTSYFFNFDGPSMAIDSACSSSLAALHLACQAIASGDCEMALAGGVNLNLHPAKYQFLSRNHFLSSDGKCRSFGEGGDGYVPGEGVGIVLLKPLSQAIADNDRIYGVIRSTAVNHGGKVTGYTVPNPMAHGDLIAGAIERAGITADEISYVECHGTGTELGDPIEITGLKSAFSATSEEKQFCGIGSVKSNIGHLEAVAGVTGLIKVLLSMRAGVLPASLHSQEENSKINFKETPFYLVKENQAWQPRAGQESVLAGVSSFGAGGSNSHCIVESYPGAGGKDGAGAAAAEEADEPQLLLLSARSKKSLQLQLENLDSFLQRRDAGGQQTSLASIALSLAKREVFGQRLAIIAAHRDEARAKIAAVLAGEEPEGVFSAELARMKKGGPVESVTGAGLDYERLVGWAERWVAGEVTHLRLEPAGGELISLPPYAFDRKRSWITPSKTLYVNPFRNHTQLHPLLDRNESTNKRGRFVKNLHKSDFILEDHLVADNHVVPGVCHLEMAKAAATAYLEQDVNTIKNVWFSKRIDLGELDELEVCCEIEEDNGEYSYVIKESSDDEPAIFSRGSLAVAEHEPPPALDLAAIGGRCATDIAFADFYGQFRRIGIIQLHSFQVVEEFKASETEALATISLPRSLRKSFSDFKLHPALMDGAVQTAMIQLLHLLGRDVSIVPFSFEKVLVHGELPERIFVYSRLENRETKTFSVQLADSEGTVLVEFVNFILKEFQYGDQALDGVSCLAPILKESSLDQEKRVEEVSGLTLIGDEPALDRELFADTAAAVTSLAAGDLADLDSALAEIVVLDSPYEDIIYYPAAATDESDFVETTIQRLFVIAKRCARTERPINLIFACQQEEGEAQALRQATASFFKVLKRENGNLNFRFVSHSPRLPLAMVGKRLLAELRVSDSFQEVYYDGEGKRLTPGFRPVALVEEGQEPAFKDGGSYLITGGLGGVGRVLARHIVENFAADVLLVGRSACSRGQLADIFPVDALKGQVHYLAVDICGDDGLAKLREELQENFGTLSGVIHCAGTINDAYLLKKEWSDFSATLAPKISGTRNLDEACAGLNLDFFLLFSSITATFGNLAQSDYAYANGFMDHFATVRNEMVAAGKRQGHTLAINWPYWLEGGMRLTGKQLEHYAATYKIEPLSNGAALDALAQAMASGEGQVVVVNGRGADIHRHLGLDNEPHYQQSRGPELIGATAVQEVDEEVQQQIRTFVAQLFMESLELEEEDLDHGENFTDMGIDSIAVIDIIQALEKSNRFANLPNTIFLEHDSIDKVVTYFEKSYPAGDYEPLAI
ncbi:MAG: SDR family NAD(P)-dependent oxidoreductase [Thermodesulfobacteriota bacterium]